MKGLWRSTLSEQSAGGPVCASTKLGLVLLVAALPAALQAQFTYTSDGTVTGYTGSNAVVTIPDTINGLPISSIGAFAFSGLHNLASVTIPNSVTTIGDYAFSGCSNLRDLTIGAELTLIGTGAFEFCRALTHVAIPLSVTNIGNAAFAGCSSLSAITVEPGNPAYIGVDGVLFNKTQTTLLQFPGGKTGVYTIPDGVISVGAQAFAFSAPTAVILPKSATTIGPYAFFECGLSSVTIPYGVTTIGTDAFFVTSLTNVTIPDSVTNVDDEAFSSCMCLRSVVIGNGLTRIANRMFQECESLTNVMLSESVSDIGVEAFASCYALRTTFTIPFNVTNLSDSAFADCYMSGFFFHGNAPHLGLSVFPVRTSAVAYYLPGTTGWGVTLGGLPTVLWNPMIKASGPGFGAGTNGFGFLITGTSNIQVSIEASTNLLDSRWSLVDTKTLSGGSAHFSDGAWTNYPVRFYRLSMP